MSDSFSKCIIKESDDEDEHRLLKGEGLSKACENLSSRCEHLNKEHTAET